MALHVLGAITIAADGTVTKSGECEVLWDLFEAAAATAVARYPGGYLPTGPSSVPRKVAQAAQVTVMATYIRTLLTVRAKATITRSTDALQVTPTPNDAGADTDAPRSDKFLSIV